MGTVAQALAAGANVAAAIKTGAGISLSENSQTGRAGAVLMQSLFAAQGSPIGDSTYAARFAQCVLVCTQAGVSAPSYDTSAGTLDAMISAMTSSIANFSALGASYAPVVAAAQNVLADLQLQRTLNVPAVAAASS